MAKLKWPSKNGFSLHDPVYQYQIWLFKTVQDWNMAMKCLELENATCEEDEHGGLAICGKLDKVGDVGVIGIFENDLGVLVHECTHIRQDVFKDRGVNDNEAEAYYTQFLFDNFRKHVETQGVTFTI